MHDKSRILILGNAANVAVEQWVSEVRSRGHEVRVMSPAEPREGLASLTVSTEAGPRIPLVRFVARILRIRSEIRRFGPDVVHAHGALDYAFWAVLGGFRPVLVTAWGSDVLLGPTQSARSRFKVRYALRRADYVTATSSYLLEWAARVAGRRLPGEVIHWGVDLDEYRPPGQGHGGDGGRAGDEIAVLSTRKHTTLYNLDVVLRAFAAIASSRGDRALKLVVAASGPETSNLESLARELSIEDRVEFLGWVEQSQLPDVYRRADIYVSAPSSDASAVSNMEAMASGLPLVLSDLPSVREWANEGAEALFVPPRDAGALAEALKRLVDDPALRRELGSNARKRIEQVGSRKQQMDRVSELYDRLAEEARA